jgi:uncharacterized membrane-anchored protein
MSKLPQITLFFWIMKICATTLGETAGDLLSMTLKVGYGISSLILVSCFLISLFTQLNAKKYHPILYWTVILTTSTAGTTMSDYMDRTLALGYAKGSFILVTLLMVVLAIWRWSEGNLSVDNVKTTKAELFYWTAILFSNTLGTALGDFLADSSGLGFGGGALLISGLIGAVVLAHYATRISKVLLFWLAFVLTRPLGATVGDLMTKTREKGGFDFGTTGSSMVLLGILVFFIVLTRNKHIRVDAARADALSP